MIDGDETTLKSILEEKNEMKQKLGMNYDSISDLNDLLDENGDIGEDLDS